MTRIKTNPQIKAPAKARYGLSRGKLLLLLGLLVIVAIGGIYVGAKYVMRLRTQSWRDDGIAAYHAGNDAQAADLLGRFLHRRPWDIEALECFIVSRERAELPGGQHLAETIGALHMLLNQQPDRLNDRRHLLELYVKIDRRPEALDVARDILKKNPNDARTLELKTQVLMRLRQDEEALAVAQQWTRAAPLATAAHLTRLRLMRQLQQPPKLIVDYAQQLLKTHPGDARFELVQADAYAQTGDRAQAENWLKKAAAHTRPQDDFAAALIDAFDRIELSKDSLALLQEWSKAGAASLPFRHTLARRLWETLQWDALATTLAELDVKDPKCDADMVAFKTMALTQQRKPAEAAACRAVLAGRSDPAARAWTTLLRRLIDAAAIDDKQITAECQAALAHDPGNSCLRYFLGEAELRLGETDLAAQAWQRVVVENLTWSTPPARLAELLLNKGQTQTALQAIALAMHRSPTSVAAVTVLARAWDAGIESGSVTHPDELLKLVGEVQRQFPGESRTLSIQIQVLAERGDKAQAIKLIRAVLATSPAPATSPNVSNVPPESLLLRLASLSAQNGLGVEEDCLAYCEKVHGPTATLALARGLQAAASGHAADGLRIFDELAHRNGKGSEMPWQLARAQYLDFTEDPAAKAAWVALGDAWPKDVSVQQAASSALAVRDDWDFMQRTSDRLKALTGENGLAWQLVHARIMVEAPRNETDYLQGSKLLNVIIQKYPQLTEPRILLASALLRMNRVDGAIDQLTVATKLNPSSVSTALQLAALLQSRGSTEQARAELDRIAPHLQKPEQYRRAALLLAQQGSADKAIEVLQQSRSQSGVGRPDLFLAVLYSQHNQLDKAEEVVKQLLEKPDLATIQFAAALYASQGRRSEAQQVLARLDSLKLDPGIQELALGSYSLQWDDPKEALKHIRLATQQAPTNPFTWRSLADCYATQGQIPEALAAVDQGLRALPADKGLAAIKQQADLLREAGSEDGMLPAVLSIFRNPLDAAPAVELLRTVADGARSGDMEHLTGQLRQLIDHYPKYLPIQIKLASCSFAMGRPDDAREVMQEATIRFATDPEPARLTVDLCSAAHLWREMLSAAQVWKKRVTGSTLGPDLAIAHAYIGLNEFDAADSQLKPYLDAASADPDKYVEVLRAHCLAIIGAGRPQAAADLLWPLAGKAPHWRGLWVRVALDGLDIPQATAWLERLATIIPANASDELALLADAWDTLGQRHKDPQLIARSTAVFAQLAADPNASASALVLAAGHAERCADPAKAESYYRRALAKDANFVAAQNNLAMLIATRGGDLKEAMALATAALQRQPRISAIQDTLALVQAKSGDTKAAATSMRRAVKLEPDTAKWRVRLAQYLFDSGNVAEANSVVDSLARMDVKRDPALQQELDALRKKLRPSTKG